MQRIIILGTGTNVGKTYVTARLTEALTAHPSTAAAIAIKPIESGVRPAMGATASLVAPPQTSSDAELLAAASSPRIKASHVYAFEQPLSPHLAARNATTPIDLSRVAASILEIECQQTCPKQHATTLHYTTHSADNPERCNAWLLIETAGGAFSPLAPGKTNVTLAQLLEPAIWLLVAPDRLGVLHDLTTTLQAMRSLARLPDSLLLTQCPPADASTGTNASELRQLGIAEIDTVVPADCPVSTQYVERLLEIARRRCQ